MYSPTFWTNKIRTLDSDLWRIGILALILRTGLLPFNILAAKKTMNFLSTFQFNPEFLNVKELNWSELFKNFVTKILASYGEKKIQDFLAEPWISQIQN